MTTGERLKSIRKGLKLIQLDFAECLGVKASAISQMENGHIKPSLDTLYLLTTKYGINLHWLLTGNGEMYANVMDKKLEDTAQSFSKIKNFLTDELMNIVKAKENAQDSQVFDIPVMGEIAAGLPVETGDNILDVVSVRRSMINGVIDDYISLRVNGHSMDPFVMHNDVVIIRKSQDWGRLNGLICAVRIDGSITLKKLALDDKRKLIMLMSINEEYKPILIDPNEHEDVSLIGSLHYLLRKLQ
ncbi:MAG: XRE family transcriptional regulator [Candidatus Cloacimonadaceae bacterium]|nr:XRE family transcriptional regulator [Candidatus Cloacimonadaceae bacterium]MDP3114475.1 XRE family transcriptional regulator [Candidatus Cloacimonadaceae bacterium]